jgi:hypothetical protein
VRSGLGRLLGEVDGVRGVERPHSGDDVRPIADRVDDRAHEVGLLGITGRGRLPTGTADHQCVVGLIVHQSGG